MKSTSISEQRNVRKLLGFAVQLIRFITNMHCSLYPLLVKGETFLLKIEHLMYFSWSYNFLMTVTS